MIVSQEMFIWICTGLTLGVAVPWVFVDLFRLKRVLREDLSRPLVRDRLFGSLIGLAVSVIGVLGMVRYHF